MNSQEIKINNIKIIINSKMREQKIIKAILYQKSKFINRQIIKNMSRMKLIINETFLYIFESIPMKYLYNNLLFQNNLK